MKVIIILNLLFSFHLFAAAKLKKCSLEFTVRNSLPDTAEVKLKEPFHSDEGKSMLHEAIEQGLLGKLPEKYIGSVGPMTQIQKNWNSSPDNELVGFHVRGLRNSKEEEKQAFLELLNEASGRKVTIAHYSYTDKYLTFGGVYSTWTYKFDQMNYYRGYMDVDFEKEVIRVFDHEGRDKEKIVTFSEILYPMSTAPRSSVVFVAREQVMYEKMASSDLEIQINNYQTLVKISEVLGRHQFVYKIEKSGNTYEFAGRFEEFSEKGMIKLTNDVTEDSIVINLKEDVVFIELFPQEAKNEKIKKMLKSN